MKTKDEAYEQVAHRVLELQLEVNELRNANQKLSALLLSPYVFIHETIVDEVDQVTKPYIGGVDV